MPRFAGGDLQIIDAQLVAADERPTRNGRVWSLQVLTSAGELTCSYFPEDNETLPDRSFQVHALVRSVGVFNNQPQFRLQEIRLVSPGQQELQRMTARVGFPLDEDDDDDGNGRAA